MSTGGAQARLQIVRFGEFEVDFLRQTLSVSGVRTKLQKQPFQVLELLIRRAPEIVSRDEIQRHVWGDSVHVDATQSINFCIRQIRSVLGDSSPGRFIETLPRQGYRFIAPFDGVPDDTGVSERRPVAGSRTKTVTLRWVVTGLITFLVLTTILLVSYRALKRDALLGVTQISPVTTYPGDEREPSLSPDGRQVAFSWEGEKADNRDIYVTLIGEPHPLRLTSDPEEDAYPAWSPDGKYIAFVRRHGGPQADIMLVPAIGGTERKLQEIRLNSWITGPMLAWSPDSKWLCFTNEVGVAAHHALFLLSLDSGTVKRLLPEEENGVGDSSPAFSPDGKWLAFGRFEEPYSSKLLLQRLSPDFRPEGRPIVVKDAGVNPKAPVWLPGGKKLLFLDKSRIMEVEAGGAAHPIYVSDSVFSELTIAGANSRVVACLEKQHEEIWTIPLSAKGQKASGNPKRLVPSSPGESHPGFSPDGRWLAFSSKRSGSAEIWLADSDGGNPRQLTHLSFYIAGFIRWSADSQYLAFHARLPRDAQIYVPGIRDGQVKKISKPGFEAPSWTADGQSLYAYRFQDARARTYKVPLAGGVPRLLFEAARVIEVPSLNLLIYEKEEETGIYSRSLTGDVARNPEYLLVTDYLAPWGGFYPVEDGIYYVGVDAHGLPRAFRFYSFETRKSIDVAPSPTNLYLDVAVTPDRTRLAYSTRARGSQDLVQIELR